MLKDAPIVILDEATASIDPENEAVIQQAISRLTEGKTLIVIAHRWARWPERTTLLWWKAAGSPAQGKQEELLAPARCTGKCGSPIWASGTERRNKRCSAYFGKFPPLRAAAEVF